MSSLFTFPMSYFQEKFYSNNKPTERDQETDRQGWEEKEGDGKMGEGGWGREDQSESSASGCCVTGPHPCTSVRGKPPSLSSLLWHQFLFPSF